MRKRLTITEGKQHWEEHRRGNIHSLGKLMQGYYPDLFHYGMRLQNEREFVKDSIQEVFLNLWKLYGTIQSVENVKAYLLIVLKSHMIRDLTNKRMMFHSTIDEEYSFSVEFSADMRMIEEEHEIYQVRKLEVAMNHLPKRQKELIYLRFYQNLSFEQIAEVMNLGRQSVYNLFQKSLNNLRKNWPVVILFAVFGIC